MAHTRHIQKRMSQRGITTGLVNLVSQFGVEHGDKLILNKKNTEALLKALENMKKDLLDIHKKGGIVVVECGDTLITTYALDSFSRKKVGGKHELH
ncbi:hypothetical protein [Rheinheimera sp. 4Y26]|uniref:hypothetical protein n=1 Tax=Rheinheimera sp. 4Y26 TaxID=2977811 RepID=UPI0021B0CA60|nr:hypothetical protein [Rheinheimera sp. 4Y26]MCT6701377.1 hypothetical protein [Rheinheimera sp. 4Y26]